MNTNRRDFIRLAGLGGLALAGGQTLRAEDRETTQSAPEIKTRNTATPNRPNIVYIHSHDTGRYIQPYGYAVPTPNIQKLADQGVLFRQCFTTHPTSSASRGSLLTGMYPHSNGLIGLAHRGFKLNDINRHLIHTLHRYGYTSALAGVQHIVDHEGEEPWKKIGYKEGIGGTWDFNEMNRVVNWLENAPENPFFLSVGFGETHRKFHEKNWLVNPDHLMPPEPIPDAPETRLDWAEYLETARILDLKMGMVFDTLQRTGLDQNTLVICTTDHGIAFPNMKCSLYDGGTGVMLIMRGPGGFTGGKTIDALVSNIDIFPTICDILEIEKPEWLQGKSMMPLINGENEETNNLIFTQINYHAAYEPVRSVRTKRYKYIRRYDNRSTPNLPNCDDGYTKQLFMKNDWKTHPVPREELYDLLFDPNERNNLAQEKNHKTVLSDMRQKLQDIMTQTNDPMLKGYINAPATARINDPEDLNPSKNHITPPYLEK